MTDLASGVASFEEEGDFQVVDGPREKVRKPLCVPGLATGSTVTFAIEGNVPTLVASLLAVFARLPRLLLLIKRILA